MAQTYFNTTRDIDTDSDSDSNSSRSGKLHFSGSDSTKKSTRRRSTSHHLLMDAIDGSEEEKIPLPDYERLSQSMRLPEDTVAEPKQKALTCSQSQGQKPIALKLIDRVFKKDADHKDKDKEKEIKEKKKEKEKEKEKEKDGEGNTTPAHKEKKKRSSWMPDPEKRWPVQGWS